MRLRWLYSLAKGDSLIRDVPSYAVVFGVIFPRQKKTVLRANVFVIVFEKAKELRGIGTESLANTRQFAGALISAGKTPYVCRDNINRTGNPVRIVFEAVGSLVETVFGTIAPVSLVSPRGLVASLMFRRIIVIQRNLLERTLFLEKTPLRWPPG